MTHMYLPLHLDNWRKKTLSLFSLKTKTFESVIPRFSSVMINNLM